jgi:hypothetical protein
VELAGSLVEFAKGMEGPADSNAELSSLQSARPAPVRGTYSKSLIQPDAGSAQQNDFSGDTPCFQKTLGFTARQKRELGGNSRLKFSCGQEVRGYCGGWVKSLLILPGIHCLPSRQRSGCLSAISG